LDRPGSAAQLPAVRPQLVMDIQGRTARASTASVVPVYCAVALLFLASAGILILGLLHHDPRLAVPTVLGLAISLLAAFAISGVATTLSILPSGELQLTSPRTVTRLWKHQITGHNAPLGNRGYVTVRHFRGASVFFRSEPLVRLFHDYISVQPNEGTSHG